MSKGGKLGWTHIFPKSMPSDSPFRFHSSNYQLWYQLAKSSLPWQNTHGVICVKNQCLSWKSYQNKLGSQLGITGAMRLNVFVLHVSVLFLSLLFSTPKSLSLVAKLNNFLFQWHFDISSLRTYMVWNAFLTLFCQRKNTNMCSGLPSLSFLFHALSQIHLLLSILLG